MGVRLSTLSARGRVRMKQSGRGSNCAGGSPGALGVAGPAQGANHVARANLRLALDGPTRPRLSQIACTWRQPAFELIEPNRLPDGASAGLHGVFASGMESPLRRRCLALRPAADQRMDTSSVRRTRRPCRAAPAYKSANPRNTLAISRMASLLSRPASGRSCSRRAVPDRIPPDGAAASPAEALAGASRQLQPSQPLPRAVSASFGEKRTDTPVAPFRQKPGPAPELPAGGPSPYHQRTPGERAEGFS
ncbi:MAG: hypothetical protein KatS3mg004_3482 [Bryobacteraceae bacterium]|nr:MAG: hypothetical protein KatS3mg004_3482 [Bryobacteraceae bacterium]